MTKRSILLASCAAMRPARAFAIDAVVDNLDNVPEALHAEYVQQGDKYVLQVTGMKPEAEFTRVNNALTNERREHGALKTRITTAFGERKFEDIVQVLDKVPELEAMAEGKLDEEKINGIVEARVRTKLAPVERERDQFKLRVGELEGKVGELTTKDKKRLIKEKAREAGTAAKLLPEAMDDFLLLADTVFEVREDDNEVVVREGTAYTAGVQPSVLLTDLQPKRPHWWGESRGGGAGGNRDGGRGSSNPWSKDNWNMTEQGRLMETNPDKAKQLAKQAGHDDPATARKQNAK